MLLPQRIIISNVSSYYKEEYLLNYFHNAWRFNIIKIHQQIA